MLTTVMAAILAVQAGAEVPVKDNSAIPSTAEIASEALSSGREEEAIATLERSRKKHADDPAVLINLGVAYAHRGDEKVARDLFKAALASRQDIDLEMANGDAMNSRHLARKALSMLSRGEFRGDDLR